MGEEGGQEEGLAEVHRFVAGKGSQARRREKGRRCAEEKKRPEVCKGGRSGKGEGE